MTTQDSGDFWAKAEKPKVTASTHGLGPTSRPPLSRWKKVLLVSTCAFVVIVLVSILFLPSIVGALAPTIVASQAPKYLEADVTMSKASLSWSGPQRIEGVSIKQNGNLLVSTDIEIEGGLLSLIRGGTNVGNVTVSNGEVHLVRDDKGVLNVTRLSKSESAPPSEPSSPSQLPQDLNIKLNIENLDFTYQDLTGGRESSVTLDNIDARAEFVADAPILFSLKSKSGKGTISTDLKISNWSDGGLLRFEKAKVDGALELVDLPTVLIDALIPGGDQRPDVRKGLGESLSLNATFKGSRDSGAASIDFKSPGLKVRATAALKDELFVASNPIEISVAGSTLSALVPALDEKIRSAQDVSVGSLPDVSIRISDFRLPLSKGEVKTLRGGGIDLAVQTSEVRGDLTFDEFTKSFVLSPTTLTLKSADFATQVEGSLSTDLKVDSSAGGSVRARFSSGGILNNNGSIRAGIPKDLRANISVQNIATALFQPFVSGTGLDLRQDIGPTIDVSVDAVAGSSSDQNIPPTSVKMTLASKEVSFTSSFTSDDRGVEFAPDSTVFQIKNAGRIISRFVKPESGWCVVSNAGSIVVTMPGAALPLNSSGGYELKDLRARSVISLSNISFAPTEPSPVVRTIDVNDLSCTLSASSGVVTSELQGALTAMGKGFAINSKVDVPGLFENSASDSSHILTQLATLRPAASVSISKLPIEIARFALSNGEPNSDSIVRILNGVVGSTTNITIATRPDQQAGVFGVGLTLKAPKLSVDVSGRISKDEIALANAQVSSTIDQSTVSTLVRELSPETKNLPTLSGPSKLNVAVGSFTLPLDTESKPVWSRAGRANITIQSDGRTVLNGIRIKSEASERDLGRLGFQSLKFNASLPFQTLFGAGQPDARSLATDFSVSILGPAQSPLFAMRAKADVEIDTAKPVGPLRVDVALERIDTRQLESMFDTSGLVASIVGDTIDFNTSISTIPGIDRNPLNIPASTIMVSTDMRATGLKTSGPVVVTMSPKSIELKSPAQFDFKIVPSVVNELMSRGDSKNASLALARSADFRISVGSLVLPKSAAARFSANASISTPDLRFTDSTGREIALADIKALVATENVGDATPLNFSFESKSVAVNSSAATNPVAIRGKIDNLIDSQGGFDVQKAVMSLGADIKGLPTILIDTLSDQNGLLVDLLGDASDVRVTADKVPLHNISDPNGQLFAFSLSSPRVSTSLNGSVTDGVFSTTVPLNISVTEVTNGLTQRFIGAVPVMKKLEKQTVQQPASISEKSLRIPVDSDMKKLNGAVIFDPGEVTYELNPTLAKLLKNNSVRADGIMGSKLQPVTLNFTNGVGVLDKYTLPIGEFSVGLEGKLDLVRKNVEMIVWIPASQLNEAVTGKLTGMLSVGTPSTSDSGTILSTLLELVPSWPFKVSGPLASPASSLTLDSDRVFEEFKKNGGYRKLIERVGGSKLKDLLKPKDLPNPITPK